MTPISAFFDLPDASIWPVVSNTSQNQSPKRKIRGERLRLQAARIVMGVLLRHLDPGTLCVGYWSSQGDFIPLGMAVIASEAGFCRRRCERAIVYLKSVGFVSIFPPQHYNNPIPYAGLRVVRAITPVFFEWAGLSEQLEMVRADAVRGLEADGGQP
jgi:hypothetical protein